MCCGIFVSIGTDLANKIISTVNPMTYISNIQNSIFVPDVTENDVWNVIAQLKNSPAGWDDGITSLQLLLNNVSAATSHH